jgi:hypothetical protein
MATDRRYDTLPQFAAIIGEELALKLVTRFGGGRLYIPKEPPIAGDLVIEIGELAAQRLARRWGGTTFEVPLERGKRERIIALSNREPPTPVIDIARHVGCTERHVYQVRREHREGGGEALWIPEPIDTNQIDLFPATDPTEDK